VYVFFGKTGVFAFTHEGKQVWQANVGSELNGWGSANSLSLHGDLVLVNASIESTALVALDRKTGKEVWRAKGVRESWNMPMVVEAGGKSEVVVATFGSVMAFDPRDGSPLWTCRTDIPWYMVPSVVAHDGIVYCIGGRNGGGALAVRAGGKGNVTEQNRLWKINKGSNVSSPIYHNGRLYWMNDVLGVAYCADAKSGTMVYEERIPRAQQVYASPVLAGGKIYYTARDGRTFVVPAAPEFKLLATNELGSRGETFNASPAVADGRLLIRSDRYLYCIGTK
jgi:outer membrane protein assembly factor BamB